MAFGKFIHKMNTFYVGNYIIIIDNSIIVYFLSLLYCETSTKKKNIFYLNNKWNTHLSMYKSLRYYLARWRLSV